MGMLLLLLQKGCRSLGTRCCAVHLLDSMFSHTRLDLLHGVVVGRGGDHEHIHFCQLSPHLQSVGVQHALSN